MIHPGIREHVVAWLQRIEAEEGVQVLFAAESGSRAWGFGSPDSDYDVRFIYAHPLEWYLKLTDARDVIERPLDDRMVDLAGWDLRKGLRLLLKSNPPLYEWLCSPIVYLDRGQFQQTAKRLFEQNASAKALAHHYHSIARGQWRSEIEGQDEVRLKKYFYVLRPLLSLQWIAANRGSPPMNMDELLAGSDVSNDVRQAIIDLTRLKQSTPELGRRSRIQVLDAWVVDRLAALAPDGLGLADRDQSKTFARADQLFLSVINPAPVGASSHD